MADVALVHPDGCEVSITLPASPALMGQVLAGLGNLGFEIVTDGSVRAVELDVPSGTVRADFFPRPEPPYRLRFAALEGDA